MENIYPWFRLKQEVEQSAPKETSLQEKYGENILETMPDSPDVIPPSPDMIPPSPPVPKPRTRTPVRALNVFPKLTGGQSNAKNNGKYFKSPGSLQNTPNYMMPTTASRMRRSPRKKDVYVSPGYGVQTEETDGCPRSGFGHSPTSDFLPRNSKFSRDYEF